MRLEALILSILFGLLLTIGIEALVLCFMKERRIKVYISMLVMNCLTNIPLNIFTLLCMKDYNSYFMMILVHLIEIGIIEIESIIYYFVTREKKRSILYGVFCNLYSYIIGGILVSILYIFVEVI